MNWGKRIIIAYGVFIAIILTMVVITFQHDVNLVTKDYYQQEIAYQGRINQMVNVKNLDQKPVVRYTKANKTLSIQLPGRVSGQGLEGDIEFFRPSDGKMDFKIPIEAQDSEGIQLDVSDVKTGFWRLKISWSSAGVEYYHEEQIIL